MSRSKREIPHYYIAETIDLGAATPPPTGQTPFNGTPIALPGTIGAADFDKGGEGVAYHDSDAANVGGAYRTGEGVDIQNKAAGGPHLGPGAAHVGVRPEVVNPLTGPAAPGPPGPTARR